MRLLAPETRVRLGRDESSLSLDPRRVPEKTDVLPGVEVRKKGLGSEDSSTKGNLFFGVWKSEDGTPRGAS